MPTLMQLSKNAFTDLLHVYTGQVLPLKCVNAATLILVRQCIFESALFVFGNR